MSGEPSPRKEKRAIPYVSPEGRRLFTWQLGLLEVGRVPEAMPHLEWAKVEGASQVAEG
jgi:hypothetical protein